MDWSFMGYRRPDGRVGIRNHLLVIATSVAASQVARRIAERTTGAIAVLHEHGMGETEADVRQTFHILAGTGRNPNVGAALVVGVSPEDQVNATELAAAIAATSKPAVSLLLRESGGSLKAIVQGGEVLSRLAAAAATAQREPCAAGELIIGSKCGGSDATSGLACNPALGAAMDLLIGEAGATVIFSETPEIFGAEHLIAARAISPEVAAQVYRAVERFEGIVAEMGVDIRGGNPTPGNIAGGLSTIEEKSLGCISKAGKSPLIGVTSYGSAPPGKGLYFMDSASNDIECVSGMVAAGCQIVCFTTGRGTPTGNPAAPVLKLCANPQTCERMRDNLDTDLAGVLRGRESIAAAGGRIARQILDVASGLPVKAEILQHCEFSITRRNYTI